MNHRTHRFIVIAFGMLVCMSSAMLVSAQSIYTPYAFTNFVGSPGTPGSADGTGTGAQFSTPHSVAIDAAGNLFVGDTFNHTIRQISPAGVVTTIAGSPGNKGYADGVGTAQAARFNSPIGIATDTNGNVFVADTMNQTVRKITPSGVVTTFAGQAGVIGSGNGSGSAVSFHNPQGIAVDSNGNVFVADNVNRTIRKITPAGVVSLFAGSTGLQGTNDGVGTLARFYQPNGMAIDSSDNLYVADVGGDSIRKITPGASVTTLAGLGQISGTNDGVGGAARFFNPQNVAVDAGGNVYVCDSGNQTIRKITPGGTVTTIAGTPGLSGSTDATNGAALFSTPRGISVDGAGIVYVADSANSTIRKLTPVGTNWVVTTLAGTAGQNGNVDATGTSARFHFPYGMATDSAGNLYAVDRSNDDIRKITPGGVVTTFAGLGGFTGSTDGSGGAALFYGPEDLTVDSTGNVYVVEFFNNTVRKVAPVGTNWIVTTLAGCASCATGTNDGVGAAARFSSPFGLARDNAGNLYVADTSNFTIRKLTATGTNWTVSTFIGKAGQQGAVDDVGNAARLNGPHDLVADSSGNLFLSDGFAIRKITSAGVVTTLAGCPPPSCTNALGSTDGPGGVARFDLPRGLALDSAGNIYVADSANDIIRKLTLSGGNWSVTTLAGSPGIAGFTNGVGSNARFGQPTGIAVDPAGTLYVVDSMEDRVTKGVAVSGSLQFDTSAGNLSVSNGFFNMHVTGPSGGSVILDISSNLVSWFPIQTNAFSGGAVYFSLPIDPSGRSFFRVHLAP